MTDTMQVVSLDRFGGPEVLTLTERPRPQPGPTEILVRVRAAGINPVDWKTRAGGGIAFALGAPPLVLGWDVSGTVEAVGFGVTRFAPGDRVFGMPRFPHLAGGYGQFVTAPSRQFARVPNGLSDAEAAALPLVGLTAWQALVEAAGVDAGQRVLIHAAAGGVGHVAVQVAKARGAHVIGTARAAKHGVLRDLGVDEPIDYTAGPFEDAAGDVDVVFDLVGGDYSTRSLAVLKPGGLLVGAGSVSADVAAAAERGGKRVTAFLVEPDGAGLSALADLVTGGKLRVLVEQVVPLAEAAKAHEVGEQGRTTGKLVLSVP
jgi:NADPH:quinone reductase-like Zn-dependent oxidoreductase